MKNKIFKICATEAWKPLFFLNYAGKVMRTVHAWSPHAGKPLVLVEVNRPARLCPSLTSAQSGAGEDAGQQLSDCLDPFTKLLPHTTNRHPDLQQRQEDLKGHPAALRLVVCVCRGCQWMQVSYLEFDSHVSSSYQLLRKQMVWIVCVRSAAQAVFLTQ